MAIRYDIILDNNLIYPIQYACFGSLNSLSDRNKPYGLQHSDATYLNGMSYTNPNLRTLETSFNVASIRYIRYHWGWKDVELSDENKAAYLKEVKYLLADLPLIKDILFFEGAYVYVSVKDQPADKVMFALSVVRNLTTDIHYYWCENGMHSNGYLYLRRRGLTPLQSLVFSQFVGVADSADWGTGRPVTYCHVGEYPNFNSESHLFNLQTFGLESYKRLEEKDPDYKPWVQGTFAENGHGYKRGNHFAQNRVRFEGFDEESPVYEVQPDNRGPRIDTRFLNLTSSGSASTAAYRSLFDCLAKAEDTTPLMPNWYRDSSIGFYTRSRNFELDENGTTVPNTGARFEYMLSYINSL